jgi:hypothetical protein
VERLLFHLLFEKETGAIERNGTSVTFRMVVQDDRALAMKHMVVMLGDEFKKFILNSEAAMGERAGTVHRLLVLEAARADELEVLATFETDCRILERTLLAIHAKCKQVATFFAFLVCIFQRNVFCISTKSRTESDAW